MILRTFLDYICRTKKLPQGAVFCFSGKEFPLLFFYHLILFFKKNGLLIESLNCIGTDIASIKALLSTVSFSGATIFYLESFSTLSAKKQQEMLQYLQIYTGPHRIILFSEVVPAAHMNVIMLPDEIAPRDFPQVRFLVSDTAQATSSFVSQLCMKIDRLSLDSACLFAQYELVLGKNVDDFFDQWMTHLSEPTSSLFVLSQHFFGKKNRSFFRQWAQFAEFYLPPFWATFWADQVWRAYVFCDLMKKKKYAEAKKAQYKLPFSFINRDWSSYSLIELRNAHHFLSTLDFQLKNGFSEIGLEHFYAQFFDGKFQ
ncbi:MAG TPA: hypothetical protein VKR54_00965 [Candidatus Babeliales bacterium]|jgi:hypothetical protein|nr:hypothetical protein [Candidatus Babeliales bacterium]